MNDTKKMWKSESAISKRCPNGYHKDPLGTGQCVDDNGNYYQNKDGTLYEDPENRKKVIEGWEKLFDERFGKSMDAMKNMKILSSNKTVSYRKNAMFGAIEDKDWKKAYKEYHHLMIALKGKYKGKDEETLEYVGKYLKRKANGTSKSTKKMKKTPVMQTWLGPEEEMEDIEFFNGGSEVTVDEIDRLAPHASVVPSSSAVDVIWYLPSGNHPGLWITTHGIGRQSFSVTATHFDYPDTEGIMPFIEDMKVRARNAMNALNNGGGATADEIRQAIIDMESVLGPIATEPHGIPLYESARKSGVTKNDEQGGYVPEMPSFRDMVDKMRNTRNFRI